MDLEQLISKIKSGDTEAFGLLYDLYYPKMRGICIKIVGHNGADVDDIVHDAFVLAFISLDKLKNPCKFGEWLTTITKNVSLKYIDRSCRNAAVPLPSVSDDDFDCADTAGNPESAVLRDELLSLVDRLPEGYGKVFRLSVIEGFSHVEIGRMLGIEPHSSSSQLSRAKKMLRKMADRYKLLTVLSIIGLMLPVCRYLIKKESGKIKEERMADMSDNLKLKGSTRDSDKNQSVACHVEVSGAKAQVLFTGNQDSRIIADSLHEDTVPAVASICQDSVMRQSGRYMSVTDSVCSRVSEQLPLLHTSDVEIVTDLKKNSGWRMLIAGSLGPALVQNVYKLITSSGQGGAGSSQSSFSTWEEYYDYLATRGHEDMSEDSVVLMNIAKNNSGDIIERERHDKPVTFGLSLTKELGGRWSLETGLQYSLLRSTFIMGDGGDNVCRTQKVHYMGIPLRVSYRIADYKRLSAYGSAGIVMHVPVGGSVKENLVTDSTAMFTERRHVHAPWQWAVNVGLGAQYEIFDGLSLYVEPTLNYYIPAGGSVRTVWTERPFTFSVPFGIRFTW